MNNGRIWCVVNPTVGLPAFLGSVAVMAFTVHFAVLTHTTWFSDYWQGKGKSKTADADTKAVPGAVVKTSGDSQFVINVTPVATGSTTNGSSFVVTITPKGDAVHEASAPRVDLPPSGFKLAVTQSN